MSVPLNEAAPRLVADLMPIAITVADAGSGEGAAFLQALHHAGAGAEAFVPEMAGGFDLAILLAGATPLGGAEAAALIAGLAAVSDRLLFVPASGAEPDLDGWFELFAEQGYQPVVDYDAGFVGQGAFLVDRNATAAETELSAFAEKLSMGGALAASTQRLAALEAELGSAGDREAIKRQLAAREAELAAVQAREAAWRGRAEAAEAELAALREQVAGWRGMAQGLGAWISAVCGGAERNSLAALRAASGAGERRGVLGRWRRRGTAAERQLLQDAALIRASSLFDAGWYVASHPDLSATGGDPVWHYVLKGAPAGADPGPWFDSAAYRATHPRLEGNPLAHAIRHKHVDTGEAAPAA